MRRLAFLLAGLCGLSCYGPAQSDCVVHCALDSSCPHGMVCEADYCRPMNHGAEKCACRDGETRTCGNDVGDCQAGVSTCTNRTWSACVGLVGPQLEVCDGHDNDCNGRVDDNPSDAPLCERQLGQCASTVHACVNGVYSGACLAEYGLGFEAFETKCDNIDNDCDGLVDGHAIGKLVDFSVGFDFVGYDGGYALVYGLPSGSGVSWSAVRFDDRLVRVGSEVALGTSATPTEIAAAIGGGRVWFLWQHASPANPQLRDEVGGASLDVTSAGATSVPLVGGLDPAMRGTIKIGVNATGLMAAWPSPTGVGLQQWSSPSSAPTQRDVVPPEPRFAGVDDVGLSSRGTTVTMAGTFFTDDAGTRDYFDGVYRVADGGYVNKFVYVGSSLLDSPKGTQSIYEGSCDYDVGQFSCHKSYLIADFDVWNPVAPRQQVRMGSATAIRASHAATTPANWVASWVENGRLYLGAPTIPGQPLSPVVASSSGVPSVKTRVASSGATLHAIVYNANPANGQLNGVLICAP